MELWERVAVVEHKVAGIEHADLVRLTIARLTRSRIMKAIAVVLSSIAFSVLGWAATTLVDHARTLAAHEERFHGLREDVSEMKHDIKKLLLK